MLDPFRKKSSVLSRFFGRGRPVPGLRFQTGKTAVAPPARAQSPPECPSEDAPVRAAEGQEKIARNPSDSNPLRDLIWFAV
jgi:hypothetical protein